MNLIDEQLLHQSDSVKITVFTPTFNRGHLLNKLYNSLLEQNFTDFEWLIIDDGSKDDTSQIIQEFIKQNKIRIRYLQQENSGKHIAINKGVTEARGTLFFIVDSDDWLPSDSLDTIIHHWTNVTNLKDWHDFAGVSGNRLYSNGQVNGGDVPYEVLDTDTFHFRHKMKIKGDKAEVYLTEILTRYPFPVYKDEKFCPESLIWNRIGQRFKMRHFNKAIYIGDYLQGGLSDRSVILRAGSSRYTLLLYQEMVNNPKLPLISKIKALINFWRFSPYCQLNTPLQKNKELLPLWSLLFYPIGIILYWKDKKITS